VLALLLVSTTGGCQLTAPGRDAERAWDGVDGVERVLNHSDNAGVGGGTERAATRRDHGVDDPSGSHAFPPVLARQAWVRRLGSQSVGVSRGGAPRWRHGGLEDLMARPAERRPRFSRWFDDANRVVAGNAAIAAARLGDDRSVDRLVGTVQSPDLTLPMRMAAIEALGTIPGRVARERLEELVEQYGSVARRSGNYQPGLHGELIRALGRRTDCTISQPFEQACQSPASDVRLAALQAWPANVEVPKSRVVGELASDPDSRVRVALLDLLVRHDPSRAFPLVQQALADQAWIVRGRAIEGLGQIGGPAARQTARGLLKHGTAHVRAAAVAALDQAGASIDVLVAVGDPSYRVRQAVAAVLPDREPAEAWRTAARRLITDVHSEVALEVIGHLRTWPLEVASPMLFAAMGSTSYAVRKEATRALGDRWEPASHFAYHAAPPLRAEQLASLRRAWTSEESPPAGRAVRPVSSVRGDRAVDGREDALPTGSRAGGGDPRIGGHSAGGKPRVPPRVIADVKSKIAQLGEQPTSQAVRRQAAQSLIELGPQVVDALTTLRAESDRLLPEDIYRRVLPAVDRVFGTLAEFASSDGAERRQAVEALAAQAHQTALGDLALERFEMLIRRDNDPLVWRVAQRMVAGDDREAAMRLEQVALSHPADDIRRRACEYFAAHGDRRHVAALLGSLDDPSQSVVVAACAALAEIGTLPDPLPLARLLASSDVHVRLAAARALSRLGFEKGQAALERLAHHGDPAIRRQVARAMGLTGNRAALGTLIRLLDDRMGVRRAALASIERLVPADRWPYPEASNPGVEERVRRWKRWSARTADGTSRLPPKTVPCAEKVVGNRR